MPADTDTLAATSVPPGGAEVPPPSTRVRRAWKIAGALLVVFLLPFGTMNVVTQLAHEEHTEVRDFPADGIRLIEVHNGPGPVRIVGDERGAGGDDTITVTAHISEGLRSTGHHERIEGDRLVLATTCPILFESFCRVTYTVDTPPGVDVLVRSDEGSVTVGGIDGAVDAESDQGSIDLSSIGGPVRADSDQGDVRASGLRSRDAEVTTDQGSVFLRFLDEPRRVSADSDQGDVEIVVPDGPALYRLTTDSDQGGVTRDIRADPDSDREITATTDQGDVILRYP